jgi:hypothetical protein
MNRTTAAVLAIALLLISGAWLWMKLQTKSIEAETAGINRTMDEIASDSTHSTPAIERVRRVTDEARRKAEANRRTLDSLTAVPAGQ